MYDRRTSRKLLYIKYIVKDWWINKRSEGDRDGGNMISLGYHTVLLAWVSCCWTAVSLLFAFSPFLSAKNTFLLLFFHFIILLLSLSLQETLALTSLLFSFPRFVHSALFSSVCFVSFPLLSCPSSLLLPPLLSTFLSSPLGVLISKPNCWYSDIYSNSIAYFEI